MEYWSTTQNNGSSSNLSRVPIFSPLKLDEQIDHVCVKRLQNDAIVDRKKQSLLLPKVCDIYRNDFGDGDSMHCLSFCIRFLKEEDQRLVIDLLNTGFRGYTIKFYSPTDTFHSYLIRMDDPIFSTWSILFVLICVFKCRIIIVLTWICVQKIYFFTEFV